MLDSLLLKVGTGIGTIALVASFAVAADVWPFLSGDIDRAEVGGLHGALMLLTGNERS